MAGVAVAEEASDEPDPAWSTVVAGPWLAETLKGLRSPEGLARVDPGAGLNATLRPYQQAGVRWLYLLNRLGLGACLADDMGLGKTIQVLALLLVLKREGEQGQLERKPSVLVAPASLLANWAAEVERFRTDPYRDFARCAPVHDECFGLEGGRFRATRQRRSRDHELRCDAALSVAYPTPQVARGRSR